MNTNQRIQQSNAYQMHCAPLEHESFDGSYIAPTTADFVSDQSQFLALPAVFHRISRGWTAREWLIENRGAPTMEVPF